MHTWNSIDASCSHFSGIIRVSTLIRPHNMSAIIAAPRSQFEFIAPLFISYLLSKDIFIHLWWHFFFFIFLSVVCIHNSALIPVQCINSNNCKRYRPRLWNLLKVNLLAILSNSNLMWIIHFYCCLDSLLHFSEW